MNICKGCGKPNPAEMNNCQYCGAALSDQGMNAQEQIPAWLESLKAIERPAPPANGKPDFFAADLVDPNALPTWMRPDSAAINPDSGKFPAMRPASMFGPNTDSSGAGNIPSGSLSAGSLIDPTALPAWMRPAQARQPDSISASSLVESDSLPGWLTGQPSLPLQSSPVFQPPQPPTLPYAAPTAQVGTPGSSTWQGPTNVTPGQPDSGIAASSLLDANSLPQWMREDNQAAQGGASAGSGSPGLSAGSLIDMNNLPGWLRTAEQEPRSGYSSPGAPATFGGSGVYGTPGPTRIENMRVPSRPRAEMAPLEQSEMAANVFSSMLGVASASSAYPLATSSQMGDYPAQQSFQAVQQAPGANQQWPTSAVSPFAQPGQQGAAPNAPAQGFAGAYQPAMQRVEYAAGYGVQNTYGMPAGGVNSPVPSSPYAPPQPGYAPGGSGMGQAAGEQRSETAGMKVARRGFLETIRGWFHL